MTLDLPVPKTQQPIDTNLPEQVWEYIQQARAPKTIQGYRTDWLLFVRWCESCGKEALPAIPETVANYLAYLAQRHKVATIQHKLTAISHAHNAKGVQTPTTDEVVKLTMRGIRRALGTSQTQKAPAIAVDLKAMLATLPDSLLGLRNRALLLLGFAGAFRRSELVSLDVDDMELKPGEDLVLTLRKSKTDQEGQGIRKGIPYGRHLESCPVRAYIAWLEATGIESGAIFRGVNRHGQFLGRRLTDKGVALVVKKAAEDAGLDPTKYAGHSLRAGLATSAAMAGVHERDIMKQTGHRSTTMLRRYIRERELFRNNPAAMVGL